MAYFCYTSQVTDVGLHILEMFFGYTLRISVQVAPFRVTRFGYTFWIHITNISRSFRVTHVGYTLRILVVPFRLHITNMSFWLHILDTHYEYQYLIPGDTFWLHVHNYSRLLNLVTNFGCTFSHFGYTIRLQILVTQFGWKFWLHIFGYTIWLHITPRRPEKKTLNLS